MMRAVWSMQSAGKKRKKKEKKDVKKCWYTKLENGGSVFGRKIGAGVLNK